MKYTATVSPCDRSALQPDFATNYYLRLALLAPDGQESILMGTQPETMTLGQLLDGVGLMW